MKNNKKILNIILAGVIATIGIGLFFMCTTAVLESSSGYVFYKQPPDYPVDPSFVISLEPRMAGLFLALLGVGIITWVARFVMISIPSFKNGIKGNNIAILTFDIISIVMMLSTLIGMIAPIGQKYLDLFPGTGPSTPRSVFYYVLVNMTAFSPLSILLAGGMSGIVYNNIEKKYNTLNVTLSGTAAISISGLIASSFFYAQMMYGSQGSRTIFNWNFAGLILVLVIITILALAIRFICVSLPTYKKGGIKGNNVAILIFDIVSFVTVLATFVAIFLPLGDTQPIESYTDRVIAAENIVFYAPAMVTISSLISGALVNHQGK